MDLLILTCYFAFFITYCYFIYRFLKKYTPKWFAIALSIGLSLFLAYVSFMILLFFILFLGVLFGFIPS